MTKDETSAPAGYSPIIKNIPRNEIDRFRDQIEIVADLIGCDALEEVCKAIVKANERKAPAFEGVPLPRRRGTRTRLFSRCSAGIARASTTRRAQPAFF